MWRVVGSIRTVSNFPFFDLLFPVTCSRKSQRGLSDSYCRTAMAMEWNVDGLYGALGCPFSVMLSSTTISPFPFPHLYPPPSPRSWRLSFWFPIPHLLKETAAGTIWRAGTLVWRPRRSHSWRLRCRWHSSWSTFSRRCSRERRA